jgi:N-6 DNA Methylase
VPLSSERLHTIIEYLKERPGHENVRGTLRELWVIGLGVPDRDINFEVPVPEVNGRLDAVFGSTVFEIKRDLRRERSAAEEGLTRYILDRERTTGNRYLGIATDGAEFVAYQLRDARLVKIEEFFPSAEHPAKFLQWLDSATTTRENLLPDAASIREEFGRDSLVFRRSMDDLRELWKEAQSIPEAALKKQLWSRHLEFVYGTLIEPDELFLQHTYLTIVAKTMAIRVLTGGEIGALELLAGTPFANIGLHGAVEADFFDWLLLVEPGGAELVNRISAQIGRFRLAEIEVDVLKAIYESLIDPRQRHYLGEYYTPDWLAEWMCQRNFSEPLKTRLLDPSCGSGTFLFHAVRHFLAAAEAEGLPAQEALERCTDHVFGLDVHPVAVLFARVTYLLAIGSRRLKERSSSISVPIYLGDALQWDVRPMMDEEEIEIGVPGEAPLRFPGSVAADPILLDAVLRSMRQLADQSASTRSFEAWLNANTGLGEFDRRILIESYEHMRSLHEAGRNHIWTYIVRNLTRPLWLSLREGRPDVLMGNPPWLRFNAMSSELQDRFRRESKLRGLWAGGKLATHQDLSAYFFARAAERYLKVNGKIAFVMPLATLTRGQYEGFRTGRFADQRGNLHAVVKFEEIWTFDSSVKPLFEVPSCVIIAHKTAVSGSRPTHVSAYSGHLPRRDASAVEARRALACSREPWPASVDTKGGSHYRKLFRQGAMIVPRRLTIVEVEQGGMLGADRNAPLVESRVNAQDKRPWNTVRPLRGQIERKFLKQVLLGQSIAPYRVLDPLTAVIPWDTQESRLLDSHRALELGYAHLARWLGQSERLWARHTTSDMSFLESLDYYGKLSSQFPLQALRVVYAKAGVKAAAAIVRSARVVIDHKLYWMPADSEDEARYLIAILNSETARSRVQKLQSEGQFGPRDFDKVMFSLPIPSFSPVEELHRKISITAAEAETAAISVDISAARGFQRVRALIRQHLAETGLSRKIDALVATLLDGHTNERGAKRQRTNEAASSR